MTEFTYMQVRCTHSDYNSVRNFIFEVSSLQRGPKSIDSVLLVTVERLVVGFPEKRLLWERTVRAMHESRTFMRAGVGLNVGW